MSGIGIDTMKKLIAAGTAVHRASRRSEAIRAFSKAGGMPTQFRIAMPQVSK